MTALTLYSDGGQGRWLVLVFYNTMITVIINIDERFWTEVLLHLLLYQVFHRILGHIIGAGFLSGPLYFKLPAQLAKEYFFSFLFFNHACIF